MIDQNIRLRHLRCFLETARLGSLSAAAEALRISQPAASKTIRELETILGNQLFDRSARRLRLTQSGRVFQQHTGAAMVELQRATDLVRDTPKAETRLLLGALPTAATDLMPLACLQFRARYPECRVRVSTGPNWLLMSQLREGSLDMVVGRMGSAEVMEGMSFRHLYSEQIAAIVRPDHPLLASEHLARDLTNYPLMLPPPGAVITPLVRALLSRLGIARPAPAFETVSLAFGRRIVQESDMVWFISRGVVRAELRARQLAGLHLEEDVLGGPVGVSMRDEGPLGDEERGMLDALHSAATEISAQQQTPHPPAASGL